MSSPSDRFVVYRRPGNLDSGGAMDLIRPFRTPLPEHALTTAPISG
ncbi:hypothetical protein [Nocardioides plantarum]